MTEASIITEKWQIALFRLKTLVKGLELLDKGINLTRNPGWTVRDLVEREFGFTGGTNEVLQKLSGFIDKLEALPREEIPGAIESARVKREKPKPDVVESLSYSTLGPIFVRGLPLTTYECIAGILANLPEALPNWAYVKDFKRPPKITYTLEDSGEVYEYVDYPLNEGGALLLADTADEGFEGFEPQELTREKIERAVELVAEQFPERLREIIPDGNDDAETVDLLLQLALFGEIVFG